MKMLDGAGIKSFLTQYLRQVRHKKVLFPQNDSRGMYVGNPFELNMLGRTGTKKMFLFKILKGACIKNLS